MCSKAGHYSVCVNVDSIFIFAASYRRGRRVHCGRLSVLARSVPSAETVGSNLGHEPCRRRRDLHSYSYCSPCMHN